MSVLKAFVKKVRFFSFRTVGFSEKVLNLLNTTVAKSYKKSSLSLWILSQGC